MKHTAGLGGSVAAGAFAGLACGPGAPACVTIGAFAGGALAAFGAGFIWQGKLVRSLSTSEFATRLASPCTDTALASSEPLLGGRPTGVIVTGAVLEAALEWQGYRIIFLTDDIPFEDMLRIYMFDADLALVDAAVLGAMYSTGTFAELSLQPPDALTFRFFGGTVWRMVLLAKREFALPFLFDPSGVSRKFKFFRHFRIEGEPQPEGVNASGQSDIATRTQVATLVAWRASEKPIPPNDKNRS